MNTSKPPRDSERSATGQWKVARQLMVAACALATLTAVFYTVENWRGQRAWENSRRKLEAQGEMLDWSKCIPAPVPDEQNIFKAPRMQEWFVKGASGNAERSSRAFEVEPRGGTELLVAEVNVLSPGSQSNLQSSGMSLRLDDPVARERAATLLSEAIGPCAIGPKSGVLIVPPLDLFKPLHLVLQANSVPTTKELAEFFPTNPFTNSALAWSDTHYLQVQPAGGNSFRLVLKNPVSSAADFLSWTEPLTANCDVVRKGLERPYARMDGDYSRPYEIPIPHFVNLRNLTQLLSQRAQCYLLLGNPEAAWRELTLVHDLCRLLLAEPTGRPMTLVAAMIDVAVAGVYVGVVEDGLRLHSWREPQLLAIQRQLKDTDLFKPVVEAFREERAATCRTFETTSPGELAKMFNFGFSGRSWLENLGNRLSMLAWTLMPRGWFFQNMVSGSEAAQELLASMDPTNHLVLPRLTYRREMQMKLERPSPYTFLAARGLPNFAKAVQSFTRNQTLVNQARLACALERYCLDQGHYPETVEALKPQYLKEIPRDLIGGRPLKYRGMDDGGCLVYSVGWDERDGGGVQGKAREEGDWVWELHPIRASTNTASRTTQAFFR